MAGNDVVGVFSEGAGEISVAFAERIKAAYHSAMAMSSIHTSPLWSSIVDRSRPVHDALLSNEIKPLMELLRDPGRHYLFYGYDNLFKDEVDNLKSSPEIQTGRVGQLMYMVSVLADAIGAARISNAEFGSNHTNLASNPRGTLKQLAAIERFVGELRFPTPFPDEHGILTPQGIISHRAIHAVYQSWRVATLAARFGNRILEIGAGLGRSAFFARQFGLSNYTIVDLPMTNVAQALFLGLSLGEDQVALTGEILKTGQVGVFSPEYMFSGTPSFDLVVNADSLTEMSAEDASHYISFVAEGRSAILSINHESNEKTVTMLADNVLRREYRCPYWLRSGYVEELFVSS
jgi:hypothetical protein